MSSRLPDKNRSPAWALALVLLLLALALHLRFVQHAGGLWRDEANLANLASRSSLAGMAHDNFPVLMPLLVHAWQQVFGPSDTALRWLGAVIGLGLVAALFAAAMLLRRAPPLIALALLALNPVLLFYGDSLRAYGLGSLAVALAFAAAWALLQKPTGLRTAAFALAATASVQALFQNSVLILAICAGAFAVCARRKDLRTALKILAGGVIAALSLLPYLPGLRNAPQSAVNLRSGFQPDVIWDNLQTALGFPLPQYLWVWLALTLIVLLGYLCKHKDAAEPAVFAAITLLVALGTFAAFLWFAQLPTQQWYFLPIMTLAVAAFDAALPPLPKSFHAAAFGLVAATAVAGAPFAWRATAQRFTNIDLLARQVAATAVPGDCVVVSPWYLGISFDRYFHAHIPWTTLPPLSDHSGHRYDLVREQMRNPATLQPVFDQISATLRHGHRVWVVGWMQPAGDGPMPPSLPQPPLKYTGWADTPYALRWDSQTSWFLRQNSTNFAHLKIPDPGDVNHDEDLQLLAASGWRTNAP
jgi:hypothetical protein